MAWWDDLGAQLGPEPANLNAVDEAAMAKEWNALNPLEQVLTGTRGVVRGMGAGLLDVAGAANVSGAANREVTQFNTAERPAIEAARSQGMGFGTVGEVIPALAARGGPFWQSVVAGGEAALQAPAGSRLDAGMRAMTEAYGIGKTLDVGAQAIGKGGAAVSAARGARLEAEHAAPVTSGVQLIGGSPAPLQSPAQRAAETINQLPQGPVADIGRHGYLTQRADDLGLELTPGQRWNNRGRRKIEAAMESNPVLGGPFDDIIQANSQRYGELGARAIGEYGATHLGPDVLGRATHRLGGEFEAITGELEGVLPDFSSPASREGGDFLGALRRASRQELGDVRAQTVRRGKVVPVSGDLPISRWANVMAAKARNGDLGARELMGFRSSMADEIHQLAQQRGTVANGTQVRAIGDMIDAVDRLVVDSAERAGVPELAGRYATARTQWRVLQAMQQGKATNPLGEIRATSVDSILRREYPMEYRRGGLTGNTVKGREPALQDLANFFDATQAGVGVMGDIVGNSGTATRSALGNALTNPTQGLTQFALSQTVGPKLSGLALKIPAPGPVAATPEWITNLGAQVGAADATKRRAERARQ